MGKKLAMVRADPFNDFVHQGYSNKKFKNNKQRGEAMSIVLDLQAVTNSDACLEIGQQGLTSILITNAISKVEKGESRAKVIAEIAILVNSFRNECENCLNKNCEMRDPKKPFKKD